MRAVLFAYHDIGCTAIQTLKEMGEEICAVFTHEDDPYENVWFGSVSQTANQLKIPVYTPKNCNQISWIEKIRSLKPDAVFSFYYRHMICGEILKIPPKGAFNLHGSLLPKYRGRSPVNWVLVKGEKETGLTLHYMVTKPDAGDIVAQKRTSISEEDTALSLFKKLTPLTRDILLETIPLLRNGTAPRIPQDSKIATYFGGRKPEDGEIDWTKPSHEIYNLVRAVTHPFPGAYTHCHGKKLFVWKTKKVNEGNKIEPGKIVAANPLVVSCGEGGMVLEKVQMEGRQETEGALWAQTNKIGTETKLGT